MTRTTGDNRAPPHRPLVGPRYRGGHVLTGAGVALTLPGSSSLRAPGRSAVGKAPLVSCTSYLPNAPRIRDADRQRYGRPLEAVAVLRAPGPHKSRLIVVQARARLGLQRRRSAIVRNRRTVARRAWLTAKTPLP